MIIKEGKGKKKEVAHVENIHDRRIWRRARGVHHSQSVHILKNPHVLKQEAIRTLLPRNFFLIPLALC